MEAIHDILPPMLIEWKWTDFWPWYVGLSIILVIALATYALFYYKNRKEPETPAEPVDPLIEALSRVREASQRIGDSDDRALAQELSNIVRYYLENNFDLPAPEKTTEEFLKDLKSIHWIEYDSSQILAELLKMCDQAKFAQQRFNRTDRHNLQNAALQFLKSIQKPKEPVVPQEEVS